jgi:hypothetical protein
MGDNNENNQEGITNLGITNLGWLEMPWPYPVIYITYLGIQRNYFLSLTLKHLVARRSY